MTPLTGFAPYDSIVFVGPGYRGAVAASRRVHAGQCVYVREREHPPETSPQDAAEAARASRLDLRLFDAEGVLHPLRAAFATARAEPTRAPSPCAPRLIPVRSRASPGRALHAMT